MEVTFKFFGCVSNPIHSYVNIYTSGASSGAEGGFYGHGKNLKEWCLVVPGEVQEEIELLAGEMPGNEEGGFQGSW